MLNKKRPWQPKLAPQRRATKFVKPALLVDNSRPPQQRAILQGYHTSPRKSSKISAESSEDWSISDYVPLEYPTVELSPIRSSPPVTMIADYAGHLTLHDIGCTTFGVKGCRRPATDVTCATNRNRRNLYAREPTYHKYRDSWAIYRERELAAKSRIFSRSHFQCPLK